MVEAPRRRRTARVDAVTDSTGAAGWPPDPTGRYEFRFFNGQQWTADVSVQGSRFVDPAGASMPPASPFTPGPHVAMGGRPFPTAGQPFVSKAPGRGQALASFVVGLVSLVVGFVPFVFVLAAGGAVVAMVLAASARRRGMRRPEPGSGMAVAGAILGALALAACVAGWFLTVALIDVVKELEEVGEHSVSLTRCEQDGRLVSIGGELRNLGDASEDYVVWVDVTDGTDGPTLETVRIPLDRVDAGDTATFEQSVFVEADADAVCTITDVRGPSLLNP